MSTIIIRVLTVVWATISIGMGVFAFSVVHNISDGHVGIAAQEAPAARKGHQCRGRHIVTDGGVDQHLPFPPALSIRRAIAESRRSSRLFEPVQRPAMKARYGLRGPQVGLAGPAPG